MGSLIVARSLRDSIGMPAMDWLMAPTTFEKGEVRGMPSGMAA